MMGEMLDPSASSALMTGRQLQFLNHFDNNKLIVDEYILMIHGGKTKTAMEDS